MTREGELAFDVSARIALAEARRFFKAHAAIHMRDEIWYAMGAHDRQRGIELPLFERLDFIKRAAGEHRIETPLDRGVQRRTRRRDEKAQTLLRIEERFRKRPLK